MRLEALGYHVIYGVSWKIGKIPGNNGQSNLGNSDLLVRILDDLVKLTGDLEVLNGLSLLRGFPVEHQ